MVVKVVLSPKGPCLNCGALLWFVLLIVCCCTDTRCLASSVSSQQDPSSLIYWEEEIPEPTNGDRSRDDKPKRTKRRLFWQGRMERDILLDSSTDTSKTTTPHSMRTNEWKLDLHMTNKECTKLGIHNKTLLLDFAETGHVCVRQGNNSTLSIGTWTLHPSGITWQFPVTYHDCKTTLQCHADLILNPFGSRPRMVRGTIVKNSRKWFRPVVATFSGEGIGHDSADVSYRERGFGM